MKTKKNYVNFINIIHIYKEGESISYKLHSIIAFVLNWLNQRIRKDLEYYHKV